MTDQTARLDAGPGHTLFYTVNTESWCWETIRRTDPRPELNIVKIARNGSGCEWEFTVVSNAPDGVAQYTKVCVFEDAFAAYTEMAPFFAALADRRPTTLDGVRAILDELGVVDATERVRPEVAR